MERRKFIIGLGALTAGGAAAAGTGAFTSVEATRNVSIDVADDSDAFLALEPGENNGDYVDDEGDEIELNFDDDADVDGTGFNKNAQTIIEEVVTIRNQGSQDVKVSLDIDEEELDEGLGISREEDEDSDTEPYSRIIIEPDDPDGYDAMLEFALAEYTGNIGDDEANFNPGATDYDDVGEGESVPLSVRYVHNEDVDELDEFSIDLTIRAERTEDS